MIHALYPCSTFFMDTLRDVGDKGNMVIVTPDGATGARIAELQTLTKAGGRAPEQDNQHRSPRPPRAMPVEQVTPAMPG